MRIHKYRHHFDLRPEIVHLSPQNGATNSGLGFTLILVKIV